MIAFLALLQMAVTCCGATDATHDPSARVSAPRSVAVTVDDLPAWGDVLDVSQEITSRLLALMMRYRVPGTGFVNEQKLGEPEPDPRAVALLEAWLDAGMDLGNHTYSHPSLYTTPVDDFQADLLRGEEVTARLLEERGRRMRYFRHPYLNTGPDLESKTALERFLETHQYAVAPVTINNDEWVYGSAYDRAAAAGDTALMSRIGEDYIRFMNESFGFYEEFSRELLGREPAQVLLIHANRLNARYFGELAEMLLERGYQFVSLDEALEDPAYNLPDEYVGRAGISWLQRWWVSQGNEQRWDPDSADWVREVAGL